MLELYENIKNRRIEIGITQDELAQKMGYTSRSTIAKIENGSIDIPQSKIKAFADALNTSPAHLMGFSETVKLDPDCFNNIEIGLRLTNAREIKKCTLDDVAKALGVNKSTIQCYESGLVKKIKLPIIEAWGKYLEINPAWIIGKSDNREVIKLDTSDELSNPDIKMIARAGTKMTSEQAENLRKYAEFMYPEAFRNDRK